MIVLLMKTWLTNTVTLESVSALTTPDRKRSYSVKGEVRTYAGGRQRAVGSLGSSKTWTFTLTELPAADVDTLVEWLDTGVTVLARDHRGQSMYGAFFEVAVDENKGTFAYSPTYVATITLQQVDIVEGV